MPQDKFPIEFQQGGKPFVIDEDSDVELMRAPTFASSTASFYHDAQVHSEPEPFRSPSLLPADVGQPEEAESLEKPLSGELEEVLIAILLSVLTSEPQIFTFIYYHRNKMLRLFRLQIANR